MVNKSKIVVTGHPYAFPYYFKVFEYLERKDNFIFVLPRLWVAKNGKIRVKLEAKPGFKIYGLGALSYGGHFVRGLFKGLLPGLIFWLPYLRIRRGAKVLYSCSEPSILTTLYNGILAKLFGYRHVLFTWQNIEPSRRMNGVKLWASNLLVKTNLRLADGVICGNSEAEKIVKVFRPEMKTIVCPLSGVGTDRFKPEVGQVWKRDNGLSGKKIILFYGALDKRKGVDVLLRAFSALNSDDVHLVIIGTGPEKENLELQTKNNELQTKVTFFDWMSNDKLPLILNSADLFVYPSIPSGGWEEQFGYAMAEASACAVPVVATRSGSMDEVVTDGKSGLLVEPNDSKQLAEAMSKILSDNSLAGQMGEFGKKYIAENFSHQVVARKIEDFLGGIVA